MGLVEMIACAACYGDPSAPETKAMNIGILALLFLLGLVLGGLGTFFGYLHHKSKQMNIEGPEDLGISRMKEARALHD